MCGNVCSTRLGLELLCHTYLLQPRTPVPLPPHRFKQAFYKLSCVSSRILLNLWNRYALIISTYGSSRVQDERKEGFN